MTLVGWLCVLLVTVAAVLFGQTARPGPSVTGRTRPIRVRLGIAVSITGPLLAAAVGLATAVASGAWAAAAAATVAAVILTAVVGLLLAPDTVASPQTPSSGKATSSTTRG
ncbi:MAG: hypothetical protein WKF47_03375 [Geodermatophilaceae bacterium]|jgi:hypothetical protein